MSEILTNCSFCSLACPLVLRGGGRSPVFAGESLLSLDWDTSPGSKYGGSLCARGNAVVEFVTHQGRLNYPYVLGERTGIDAAVKEAAKNLSAILEESGSEAVGVLIGDNLTNEEAALALSFANDVLGTGNIAVFAPDDVPMFRAYLTCDLSGLKPADGKPGGDRFVSLLIGDPFAEHPCTAKEVIARKYETRGSEIIVVSPVTGHAAWFAGRHLRCSPGGEAAVAVGLLKAAVEASGAKLIPELGKLVSGVDWNAIERLGGVTQDEIEGAAKSMLDAAALKTYVSNIFGRFAAPDLTYLAAEAVTKICPGESELHAQFVQQNTWGVYSTLAGSGGDTLRKLADSSLKALVILGLDIFSAYPAAPVEKALRDKKFTVTTQLFWNQTAERANVVIPAVGLIEKQGTVSPAFDEDLVREKTITPPGGTVSDGDFLKALAAEMGKTLADAPVRRKTRRGTSCGDLSDFWTGYKADVAELDSADTVLVPWSDPVHFGDGSISRNFNWSDITTPEPILYISHEYADEHGFDDGDRVAVTSDGGESVLTVRRTKKLAGTVTAGTIHFPAVRKLFPWKLNERFGEVGLAPVAVKITKQSEKN